MSKTWKPTVAGILELIAGIIMIVAGTMLGHLVPLLIIFLTAGTIAMTGGICALTRRVWWLAVVGAIATIFCAVIIGVPSLWLILDVKQEFK